MPRWTERTDAIERIIEAELRETHRRVERKRWQRLHVLGPVTAKTRYGVPRLPRCYGSPRRSFGTGWAATAKALTLPRWRVRRGLRIGVIEGTRP